MDYHILPEHSLATTRMLLSDELKEVLAEKLIHTHEYRPAYGGESVGLDLYNAGPDVNFPSMTSEYLDPKQREKVLVPTGIKLCIPRGYVALIRERGSITKTPLIARAGVIDPGYTGEVFVNMVNTSNHTVTIRRGEKLPVQLIIVAVSTDFKTVSEEQYNHITGNSQRKEGKIGSTD